MRENETAPLPSVMPIDCILLVERLERLASGLPNSSLQCFRAAVIDGLLNEFLRHSKASRAREYQHHLRKPGKECAM